MPKALRNIREDRKIVGWVEQPAKPTGFWRVAEIDGFRFPLNPSYESRELGGMERMGVVERPVASPEAGCARNGALDISAGSVDGAFDRHALGKSSSNSRGKRA